MSSQAPRRLEPDKAGLSSQAPASRGPARFRDGPGDWTAAPDMGFSVSLRLPKREQRAPRGFPLKSNQGVPPRRKEGPEVFVLALSPALQPRVSPARTVHA